MWHLTDIMFAFQNFLLFSSHLRGNNKESRKSVQPQHITICIQAHLQCTEIPNQNVAAEYHNKNQTTRVTWATKARRQFLNWLVLDSIDIFYIKSKLFLVCNVKNHFIGTQLTEFVKIQVWIKYVNIQIESEWFWKNNHPARKSPLRKSRFKHF